MTGAPLCQQDAGVEVGAGPLPEDLVGAQRGQARFPFTKT